jgi:hypothetical protein
LSAELVWQDENGIRQFENSRIVDISTSGMAIETPVSIPASTNLVVRAESVGLVAVSTVRNCRWHQSVYRVGIQCSAASLPAAHPPGGIARHQEIVQAAAESDPGTLERVYRKLAKQYHPDNQQTGSAEAFLRVREAFAALSALAPGNNAPAEQIADDAAAGVPGEIIFEQRLRRMKILALLYRRKSGNCRETGLSPLEISVSTKSSPDDTDFALWYLLNKRAVTCGDSARYEITPEGIDLLEQNAQTEPRPVAMLAAGAAFGSSRIG